MNRTFQVWSRYTGIQQETVTVTRALGATTLDKILHLAHQYGWLIELGFSEVARQGGSGDFAILSPDAKVRIRLVIGAKGQITWFCLTTPDGPRDGQLIPRDRYGVVARTIVHYSPVPTSVKA